MIKAQYGEKQAPKLWNDLLNKILTNMNFVRCPVAPCLYLREIDDEYTLCSVHVDDGLLCSNKEGIYDEFINEMRKYIREVNFSPNLKKFTGVELDYNREDGIIKLGMKVHIEKLRKLTTNERSERIPLEC